MGGATRRQDKGHQDLGHTDQEERTDARDEARALHALTPAPRRPWTREIDGVVYLGDGIVW